MSTYIPLISKKFSAPAPGFSLPRTAKQWEVALKEVKLLYGRRQYKQCAARSNELLNSESGAVRFSVYVVYKGT